MYIYITPLQDSLTIMITIVHGYPSQEENVFSCMDREYLRPPMVGLVRHCEEEEEEEERAERVKLSVPVRRKEGR